MTNPSTTTEWTLLDGRRICHIGVPLYYIARLSDPSGSYAATPVAADDFAKHVVALLNLGIDPTDDTLVVAKSKEWLDKFIASL